MPEIKDILLEEGAQQPTTPPNGDTYLLVIAIDDYMHYPKLNNCVKYAKDVAKLLQQKYQFEEASTFFLLDAEATRINILETVKNLRYKVREQDSLVIYYSGYGSTVDNVGYWIPVEAKVDSEAYFICFTDLKRQLEFINSLHTLLIADACFSGNFTPSIGDIPNGTGENIRSRWCFVASDKHLNTSDGYPFKDNLFARSLLKNLGENTEKLGVRNLALRVIDEIHTKTEKKKTPVSKPMDVQGNDNGQFYFKPKLTTFIKIEEVDRYIATKPEEPLLEEAWWKRAILMDNSEGLKDYITRYERGNFAQDAKKVIRQKEEEECWNTVLQRSEVEINSYIESYPMGKFVERAKVILETLKNAIYKGNHEFSTGNPVPKDMVLIRGGTFQMGDVLRDITRDRVRERNENKEHPIHEVALDTFYLGKYAVTCSDYNNFVDATTLDRSRRKYRESSRRPVTNVSWFDAVAYCNWRSQQEGLEPVYTIDYDSVIANWNAKGYRLPTEAEWEYAARERGKAVRFGNGKDIAKIEDINFAGNKSTYSEEGNPRSIMVEVGSLPPNDLGLHEMSGNALEWCWDWFGVSFYENSPPWNPKGPDKGALRILRGGARQDEARSCRVAYRFKFDPKHKDVSTGFRLARSL